MDEPAITAAGERIHRAARAAERRAAYVAALCQLDGEDQLDDVLQLLFDITGAMEQTGVDGIIDRAREAIDRGSDAARIRRRARGTLTTAPMRAVDR